MEWEKAHTVIEANPRFEHMKTRKLDDELWWFVCAAHLGRTGIVERFITEFERQPETFLHYFPVEHLVVDAAIQLPGAQLLPAATVPIPSGILAFEPELANRAVVEVEATGTDLKLMMGRARRNAEHALRVLRAILAESREIHDSRLRFVLATTGWRDDSSGTYSDRPLAPTQITTAMYADLVAGHPVSDLPAQPRNDVEAHAALALRWFERAQMTEDQLTRLLFLFFALEAILGDRSASMKGANLAVRRAMLGFVTTGQFVDPSRIFVYYDEVRSNAVHGDEPVPVTQREVDRFSADIRNAINQFLGFAEAAELTKRKQVRKELLMRSERAELVANLRARDQERWDGLEEPPESAGIASEADGSDEVPS